MDVFQIQSNIQKTRNIHLREEASEIDRDTREPQQMVTGVGHL